MGRHENTWQRYPRNLEGAWHAIDDLRDAVDELTKADEIAQAVTEALAKHKSLLFSRTEKILGLVFALILTVGTIVSAVFSIAATGH